MRSQTPKTKNEFEDERESWIAKGLAQRSFQRDGAAMETAPRSTSESPLSSHLVSGPQT